MSVLVGVNVNLLTINRKTKLTHVCISHFDTGHTRNSTRSNWWYQYCLVCFRGCFGSGSELCSLVCVCVCVFKLLHADANKLFNKCSALNSDTWSIAKIPPLLLNSGCVSVCLRHFVTYLFIMGFCNKSTKFCFMCYISAAVIAEKNELIVS